MIKLLRLNSRDIETYISQGNYLVASSYINGFNQKMNEYLNSKIVICYVFEGNQFVYVHKDHIDNFKEGISRDIN